MVNDISNGYGLRGIVFDIQRYSIHDGPGIRTLVFLKGCPLNCLWCANPESWSPKSQLFYSPGRCVHCGECVKTAPDDNITMDDVSGKLSIRFSNLNNKDFLWVKSCPSKALCVKGSSMSADEVFKIVMQDEAFYRQSGGGITLSGGEPLIQIEFVKAVLLLVRNAVISTAVETSGEVPLDNLLAVSHYTDIFLYDFKIFDEMQHIKYTGVSNRRIKENLSALAETGAKILVRMPLIPGINDGQENLQMTLAFLKEIDIKRFTVLPFHQYGSGKYESIGKPYSLHALRQPENALIDSFKRQIIDAGFSLE